MHIFLKFSYQFSYNFERSDPKRVWQNRLNVELSTRMNIKIAYKDSPPAVETRFFASPIRVTGTALCIKICITGDGELVTHPIYRIK